MTEKILIASPIQNRGWILPYFLDHIKNIEYDKSNLGLFFLFNDSSDNSYSIISKNLLELKNIFRTVKILSIDIGMPPDKRNNIRRDRTYSWLAILRNIIIEYFLNTDYDRLFMIDCDILVKPDSLKKLLSFNKDIISIAIANDRGIGQATNVLKKQKESTIYIHIPLKDINSEIPFECDLTGACILINRNVLKSHCRYSRTNIGEDLGFCEECKKNGFRIYAIKGFAEHIMEPNQLLSLNSS